MSRGVQTKSESMYGNRYSPYESQKSRDMSSWCSLYKLDPRRHLLKDGLKFSRIIDRCEYYLYPEPAFVVFIELSELLKIGDTLTDEHGNEFAVDSFVHMQFSEIPDWYPTVFPMVITGNSYEIGEYLANIRSAEH